MQSFVAQRSQTACSRTFTSSGESVEAMKLNCPMGQTNLQNAACLKSPSITSTAAKYASTSAAVHHGEDHKSKSSYKKRMAMKRATEIHLLRRALGQSNRGRKTRRATLRTSMNGQAKQKKLPAQSSTKTSAPRK